MPLPPLPTAALPRQAPSPSPAVFQFDGASLGMSLQDWRAAPFPESGPGSSRAKPICSDDALAKAAGLEASPSGRDAGTLVCAYGSRYGRYVLTDTLPLDAKYRAQDMRYSFRDDRLFRIEYQTTVNAYDDLVSQFDGRYGPAVKLVRDEVTTGEGRYARVTRTWRAPGLTVDLVDPVPRTFNLSVSFTAALPGPAPVRASSGAPSRTGTTSPPA